MMKIPFVSLARRAAALGVIALAIPALATAVPLPGDTFEADDGNLVLNTNGNVDWNTDSPAVSFDAPQAADNSFTNGAQEDNPSSTWGTTTAPVNSKADITRVYMKSAFPFFRLGIVRNQAANGTVAFHVELDQSSAKHANGLPVRTVGDALFVYEVQGNNTTATIRLHRWIASGQCATNTSTPCWGVGTTLNATQAIGANHAGPGTTLDTVADPDMQLAAKTFDELAVNLTTALGVPQNSCINFGQVWVKTREGGSFGSALQDLMGPLPISVGNCDVAIEKDVVKVDDASVDNPASVPYGSVIEYRVRVFLGAGSAPITANLLSVTDTSISDNTLDKAPLAPVMANGDILGDTNGNEILEVGEKWVYALNSEGAPVVQVAASCDDVVNSAKVAVTGGDTNSANNQATRTTRVVCTPDLVIDKSAPESVDFGDTITYAITVRHTDASDPLGIPVESVTDQVGANAGVALSLLSGDDGDGLLEKGEVWTYGKNGGPMTVTPETCDDVVNTVTLAASMDANAENNTDSVTTKVVCEPDLVIDKSAPDSVKFGETITYGVKVSHAPGSDPLAIPIDSVMDELAGQSAVALSLQSGDDGNAKLDMGETWTYGTGDVPVTYTPATCDDVVNTVTLAASPDANAENNTDSVTTKVVCKPDLVIEKYADVEQVDFGGKITYTIKVRHTVASDPLRIPVQSVIDTLGDAPGVELTLAGGDDNGNTLLDKGEVWTYGLQDRPVTHTADRCAPVINTVTLTADGDTNAENNTANVTVPVTCTLDIAIAKTSDKDIYVPGDTINYTITVTNTGQATIPFGGIVVDDPTLPQLTPVNPPAELASGESVTLTGSRAVTTADCGQVTNTATASLMLDGQLVAETDSTNNTATRDVTVNCTLDIAIAKSADKPSYAPGETISYTVTVTNTGQLQIPFGAIKVFDPTLPALTLSGATPEALAPGQSLVYTGARPVTAAQCGQVVNTATVSLTGDLQAEVTLLNNTASVAVAVAGEACNPVIIGEVNTRIAIRKVGPKKAKAKQAVAYTILVTNTGTTVAKNVMVVDPLPAGMVIAKRPANATFNKGKVTWTVGDLKPGQSVTLRLLLRTDVNLTRTRCNIATASASNAPTVRGKACTTFTRVLGAVLVPRVTG
jgi:uncharacterized repeat protein (TIGR01451 family)